MTQLLANLLTQLLRLAAKIVSSSLEPRLERWAARLTPDLPWLSGTWIARFRFPKQGGGSGQERLHLNLRQFGPRVDGVGYLEGEAENILVYEGYIRRNLLYGSFRPKERGVVAGVGAFIVKIGPDLERLRGHCAWYQSRLDAVWSSSFQWVRKRQS